MIAHQRSASGGLCFILKFWLDRIYIFGDRAIFIFWHFGLKLPIHAYFEGVLGTYFPQKTSSIFLTPKRNFLARKHVVWAINRENRSNGSTWAQDREKRTGQSNKRLCYCRGTARRATSVEIVWPFFTELLTRSSANPEEPCEDTVSWNRVKCCTNVRSTDCMWKRLQPVNDFQGHSRSLPLPPFDRPYTISY